MSTERPPTIDPVAAHRWAHHTHTQSPWLHEEVARRMEERLQWIVTQPQTWVHWNPLRGGMQAHELLARRYPDAQCFALSDAPAQTAAVQKSLAAPWWSPARWTGKSVQFEAPTQPVQMLWANMALHMAADPQALIEQWHGLLAVDGFLMFSCLGPDSLDQLRRVYAGAGWPPMSHQFTDMHDWGDMLVRAGFAEPVMDMERVTLTYTSPQTLLAELRELGRNLHPARFAGLRGRAWHARLMETLAREMGRVRDDGRLELTFEINYGHAFKPVKKLAVKAETTLSLDDMRQSLKQPRK